MTKYRFDWINNGVDIEPEKVYWNFAGFDTDGHGVLMVNVVMECKGVKITIPLSTVGQTTDRSDESIEKLMTELLKPYVVK